MIKIRLYPYLKQLFNRYRRYLSNLGATFISQAVSALSILLLTPVLLRSLGQDGFSVYGVLLNIIVFSSVFDFGLNIGLLRKLIHEKESAPKVINAVFFFFIAVFICSIPLYYILFRTGILQSDYRYLITSFITALIVIQNMLVLFFDVIIQSANKIFVGRMIRVIKTVIEFIVLYLVSGTGSISSLLLATSAINFGYIGILFIYSRKEVSYSLSLSHFSLPVLLGHIRYCFWYFQNTLASVLVYNAQVILISAMVSSAGVTRYLLVMRFYDVIRLGLANFTMILFPSLSMLQAGANWHRLKTMFTKVLLRVIAMVVLVFAIVLTLGEKAFVYWSKYNDPETIRIFQLYSVLIALLIIEHVPAVFLSALKFNKLPSIVSTIQGVSGLLLSYLLLPRYGIPGAISGSLIAFLCTSFLFNPIYLFKKMKMQTAE